MQKQRFARIALLICSIHSALVAAHGLGGGSPRHHHDGAVSHCSHCSLVCIWVHRFGDILILRRGAKLLIF